MDPIRNVPAIVDSVNFMSQQFWSIHIARHLFYSEQFFKLIKIKYCSQRGIDPTEVDRKEGQQNVF